MISDDELRNELKKFGDSNIPRITDKNREIYFKKLNHYRARQKLEENPSKQAKAVNMSKYSTVNSTNRDDDSDVLQVTSSQHADIYDNTRTTRRSTGLRGGLSYVTSNYDDSMNNVSTEYVQVNNAHTSPMSNSILNVNGNYDRRQARHNVDTDVLLLDGRDTTPPKSPAPDLLNARRLKQKIELDKTLQKYRNDISDILEQSKIRARLGTGKHIATDMASTTKTTTTALKDQTSSSGKKIPSKWNYFKNHIFAEFNLKISKLLPYAILVIFLLITLQYVRMKMNINNMTVSNLISGKDSYPVPEMYCADIKDSSCSQTKQLARVLIDHLRSKAGDVDCKLAPNTDKIVEKSLHFDDVVQLFENKDLIKQAKNRNPAMHSVMEAILVHPHWQLKLLDSTYKETDKIGDVLYFLSTISLKSFKCRFAEILHTFSVTALIACLVLVVASLIFMVGKLFHKQYQANRKSFYELVSQVVGLVEKQYEMSVVNQQIKPYVAISHVYDTLIDHSQRKSQKQLWQKVVKFIADHESRIRVETQLINGEETLVWKWIVPVNLINPQSTFTASIANIPIKVPNMSPKFTANQQSTSHHHQPSTSAESLSQTQPTSTDQSQGPTTVNSWQGGAFLKQEKIMMSPTPCLKIRNMFDSSISQTDPNFMIKIHNDILTKCKQVLNSIVHVSCDKKSKEGCVYIKCSSNDAAGKIYTTLNNSWYNGKLLNVKFLREDRYLERFPDSANCYGPVKFIS